MALPPPFARTIQPRLQHAPALVRPRLDHILVALPLAKFPLVILRELPRVIIDAFREPKSREKLKPLDRLLRPDARAVGIGAEARVADDAVSVRLALKRPVDLG